MYKRTCISPSLVATIGNEAITFERDLEKEGLTGN